MSLLDKYLPVYDYNEIHSIVINSPQEECYKGAMSLDLSKSKIISFLFRLRGLPFSKTTLEGLTKDMKFTMLEETHFSEFIYGFWLKKEIEWVEDKAEFASGGEGYGAKVVWQFMFTSTSKGMCEVSTETRVKCLTKKVKVLFSIYWFFIKPFSGLIRMEMLKLLRRSVARRN